jgi:RNA polymerase sigma-70 factor (ECF subfamily)
MAESHSREPDDFEIVRRVIDGETNAFESIIERHGRFASAIVRRHVPYDDAEDTLQNVFLRVYKSLPSFKNRSSFRQWLSVIAVRTCHDFWRERYKSQEFAVSSLGAEHETWLAAALSEESDRSFQERRFQREAGEILDRALGRLSAGDRMVMELVYLEGHSLKEAAVLTGWSVANVKVRLFRSRKKLYALIAPAIEGKRSEL